MSRRAVGRVGNLLNPKIVSSCPALPNPRKRGKMFNGLTLLIVLIALLIVRLYKKEADYYKKQYLRWKDAAIQKQVEINQMRRENGKTR